MKLSCLLLGCFFSFYIFAESSEKTYGNNLKIIGDVIKNSSSIIGVGVDSEIKKKSGNNLKASSEEIKHSIGVAVDGEAMGEMCLSPEATVGDAGSSLSLDFTEPKPLLPAGKDAVYIQNGRVVFRESQLNQEKSYCKLKIKEKNISGSMQLIESPIKVREEKEKRYEYSLSLEDPFDAIYCISTKKINDLRISEFKKIVGDSMRVNLNCSKLGASKGKK